MVFVGAATNWKNFGQVKSENLGQGDKPDYFTNKATVIFLRKENCMYMVGLIPFDKKGYPSAPDKVLYFFFIRKALIYISSFSMKTCYGHSLEAPH